MQHKRHSSSAPAVLITPEKKRKKWSDEQMVAVIEIVERGLSSVNQAALQHGVPKTTLKNRLSGHIIHGTKSGPRPHLDKMKKKCYLNSFISVLQLVMGKHGKMC